MITRCPNPNKHYDLKILFGLLFSGADFALFFLQVLKVTIPRKLKRITRVVEKAQLKGGGSAACVKDIVRAMSVVDSMAEIAEALKILLYLQTQGKIRIVRVKERFLEAPSGGGWRGNTCLVNE